MEIVLFLAGLLVGGVIAWAVASARERDARIRAETQLAEAQRCARLAGGGASRLRPRHRPSYRSTDLGVATSRVTSIAVRSISSPTRGLICCSHSSDSYTAA